MQNKRYLQIIFLASITAAGSISAQDITAPTISSVNSSTADGSYALGKQIDVTVYFSEAVTLTDARLDIVLETGATDRTVQITAISASASASGTYTVESNDESADLSVNSISLTATGANPSLADTAASPNAMIVFTIPADSNLNDFKDIIIDAIAPATPAGLTVQAGNENIAAEWKSNSETDFAKYLLFGGTSTSPTTKIDSTTTISDTSTTISGLTNDTTYYYRLKAVDALGNESDYSEEASAIPFSMPVAGNVRDGDSVDVNWWNSTTTLSANWDSFQDNGAVSYQYAIGSSPQSLSDVVPWIGIGGDTSVISTGLNLIQGSTYYVSVRGTDFTAKSDTTTSNGVTVDLTKPVAGNVIDGLTTDLTFANTTSSLSATWSGFIDSLSGIELYSYSVSDTSGLGDEAKWDTTSSTSVTLDSTFRHGNSYFFSVTAVDSAGNISDTATSSGITIDTIPPVAGQVIDLSFGGLVAGSREDLDWTTDSTMLSAYFSGSSDDLSGIEMVQYGIGTDSSSIPSVVGWTEAGTDSSAGNMGLALQDAETYYFFIRAIDTAGNVSDSSFSDGITVDISPPAVVNISPDTTTFLRLIDTTLFEIEFSEEIDTAFVEITSNLGDSVSFFHSVAGDTALIHLLPPLISLDTLTIQLRNITDMRGLVGDTVTYEFHAGLLADFNDDLEVNVQDMTSFISQWPGIDIGPVSGTLPHVKPVMDDTTDLRDGMAFARMWRWSQEKSDSLFRFYPPSGRDLSMEIDDRTLTLQLPARAASGRIALQAASRGDGIRHLEEDGVSSDRIILTHASPDGNILLLTTGYLQERQDRVLSLSLPYANASLSIQISYIFYSKEGDVIAAGTHDLSTPLVPQRYALHQNYPNPFNPLTKIRYDLPHNSDVEIIIYDILGHQVRTLVDQWVRAGYHSAIWDGKGQDGKLSGSGIYFCQMRGGDYIKTTRMILLR